MKLKLNILSFIIIVSLLFSDNSFIYNQKMHDSLPSDYNDSILQQVDTIIISGNKNTKNHIIKREILHPIHTYLDSLDMAEDINRLYNLGIFSTVDINVENNIYNINVVESFAMLPDLVIDYNETLKKWSYGLGVSHINFLGLNQNLYFGGAFIGEKWFALSLYNPWIYGDHVSLRTMLFNRFSDNSFYNFSFNETYFLAEFGFYKGLNNKFQFALSYYKNKKHEVSLNNDLLPSNEEDLYRYLNLDFSYQYDTRDVYRDPLKGHLLQISTGYSKSLISSNYDITHLNLSFSKFFLLESKYLHEPVFSYQIYTLLKFPNFNKLPIHEYEYLGGEDFIRGYYSDEFPDTFDKDIEVSNIIYNHLELQSTIFKKRDYGKIEFGIDGLLFINSGVGSKEFNSFSLDNLLVGYGFGFKFFITGPPPISLTFGFNPYGQTTTHFSD